MNHLPAVEAYVAIVLLSGTARTSCVVCADTITIPILVNTMSLEAGDELVLLVTEAPVDAGAHMGAKRQQKGPRR